MLLRALIVLLLLGNLAFLAWHQGWLEPMAGPERQAGREPGRLQRQVAPQLVQASPALPKPAAKPASAAASAASASSAPSLGASAPVAASAAKPASPPGLAASTPSPAGQTPGKTGAAGTLAAAPQTAKAGLCLESGAIDGDEAWRAASAALERAGLPAGSYTVQRSTTPAVWAVTTIRLFSKDFGARKEETLKRLKVPYEPLKGFPNEDPTLLISRHESEAAANKAMEALNQRYLRGLRVMQIKPAQPRQKVRIEQATPALQTKLAQLKEPALGSGFAPCTPAKPG